MARDPEITYYTEANELTTNLQTTCLKSTSVKLLLPFNLCVGLRTSVFFKYFVYLYFQPQGPHKELRTK